MIVAQGNLIDGFGMGSGTHLRVGRQGVGDAYETLEDMGVRWNREDIPWAEVEPTPGTFRWAYEFGDYPRDFDLALTEMQRYNIEMIALLDYGPGYLSEPTPEQLVAHWENYVQAVVDEFGDRVDYWEIGNEMNSREFWGKVIYPQQPGAQAEPDPILYTRMLRVAHDIIKEHNSQDTVILGGLIYDSGFDCATNPFAYLARLNKAGAWDYFDVVAIHPYRRQPPEMFIERLNAFDHGQDACRTDQTLRHNLIGEIRALKTAIARYGNKPLWITEIGWDESWLQEWAGYRGTSTDAVEADFLIRTYVPLLAEPDVDKVFWYTQYDDTSGIEFRLNQPGQNALHIASTLLLRSRSLGQVRGQDDQGGAESDDVYEYRFQSERGLVIVMWKARGGNTPRAVTISNLSNVESLRVYDLQATDLSVEAGQELEVQNEQAVIQLTESPVFLVAEETNWLDRIWQDIQRRTADWWAEQQSKIEDWWAEQQDGFETWWTQQKQELERKLEVWLEEQLQEFVEGLCSTAYLPIFAFAAVFLLRHREHRMS
jgi:hypothetical protein